MKNGGSGISLTQWPLFDTWILSGRPKYKDKQTLGKANITTEVGIWYYIEMLTEMAIAK